tara:strand:+ start:15275 stop:15760 length:486 start_codon:yes stop_codon:yes gene_type:complete
MAPGLADVADAVLAQLPAAEPLGYRLLIERSWPCRCGTIFEAVAVTAFGTTAYKVRTCLDKPRLPVSEWKIVVARDDRALRTLFRLTMRQLLHDAPVVRLVPPDAGCSPGETLQFGQHCWDLGGFPESDCPTTAHAERVLADAVAALGLLRGAAHGPFAWA